MGRGERMGVNTPAAVSKTSSVTRFSFQRDFSIYDDCKLELRRADLSLLLLHTLGTRELVSEHYANTHVVAGGVCWLSEVCSRSGRCCRVENRSPVQVGWRSGGKDRRGWRHGAVSGWDLSHLSLEQLQDHVNVSRHPCLQTTDRE